MCVFMYNEKKTQVQGVPKNVKNVDNLSVIVEKSEISECYNIGKINLKLRFWYLFCYNWLKISRVM